jgi:hypothetical protein
MKIEENKLIEFIKLCESYNICIKYKAFNYKEEFEKIFDNAMKKANEEGCNFSDCFYEISEPTFNNDTQIFYINLFKPDLRLLPNPKEIPMMNKLEIANLIVFLRKILKNNELYDNNKIELKTTMKGVAVSTIFSTNLFTYYFELFANKMLYDASDGLYEYEFGWNFRESLKIYSGRAPIWDIEEDDFYIEPYTDDELNTIIDYETKQELKQKKLYSKENVSKGEFLLKLETSLKKNNIFDLGKRGIKTKMYSFLYDYFVLIGKYPDLGAGFLGSQNEKYRLVNNDILAYERQSKKLDKKIR